MKNLVQEATKLVAKFTEPPASNAQTYQVFYAKVLPKIKAEPKLLSMHDFHVGFVKVADVQAINMGDVMWKMQGEQWSPNGEAQSIIHGLDLHHTTMSEGDIIKTSDLKYYMATGDGFEQVTFGNQKSLMELKTK